MVRDGKVINIYDHIQVLIVFHMFVHMNEVLTMDQIEDRFLYDNNINNVLVSLFDQIQFDILDLKKPRIKFLSFLFQSYFTNAKYLLDYYLLLKTDIFHL